MQSFHRQHYEFIAVAQAWMVQTCGAGFLARASKAWTTAMQPGIVVTQETPFITEAARSTKPVAPGDLVTRTEEIVSREFQDSPDDKAAILDVLSGYYDTKEEYPRAEELLRQALDITRDSDDADLRRRAPRARSAW